MNSTDFQFKYSIESETQRIINTIKKWQWYTKNGYKPRLPEGFLIEKIYKYSKSQIAQLVSNEFVKNDYNLACDKIVNDIKKYCDFSKKISSLGLKPQEKYEIYLTKYGTSGSYKLPNKIVLSIRRENPVPVLIHEMIHLSIEELILKFQINQFIKERIVDLILDKIYPSLKNMQNQLSESESNKIDAIFNMFYPNIKEIIKQISALSGIDSQNQLKTTAADKQKHYRNYINR